MYWLNNIDARSQHTLYLLKSFTGLCREHSSRFECYHSSEEIYALSVVVTCTFRSPCMVEELQELEVDLQPSGEGIKTWVTGMRIELFK